MAKCGRAAKSGNGRCVFSALFKVGWATVTTLATALPLAALTQAIRRRHPPPGPRAA
jgi:hypothetical protein